MSRAGALPRRLAVQGEWRNSAMSASDRGYGHRWQKARADYLSRNPACVMCDAEGIITRANTVDHIVPHKGDERLFWDEGNWQALCASHHSSHKQKQERREARGVA